jgi:hypothetical protein
MSSGPPRAQSRLRKPAKGIAFITLHWWTHVGIRHLFLTLARPANRARKRFQAAVIDEFLKRSLCLAGLILAGPPVCPAAPEPCDFPTNHAGTS